MLCRMKFVTKYYNNAKMDGRKIPVTLTIKNLWSQIQNVNGNHIGHRNYLHVSPKFSNLLKKVNTSIETLQPITFQEFLFTNELTVSHDQQADKNEHYDRYEAQIQRRKKKVQILLEMEKNHPQKSYKKLNTTPHKPSKPEIQNSRKANHPVIKFKDHKLKKTQKSCMKSQLLSQHQHHNKKAIKSRASQSKRSVFSCLSRQVQTEKNYKKNEEINIFSNYTQGIPYIQEYYFQLGQNYSRIQQVRLDMVTSEDSLKEPRTAGRWGKINRQSVGKQTAQDQYVTIKHQQVNKKNRNHQEQVKNKCYQQNQYDMRPHNNQKEIITNRIKKNTQRQKSKQLLTRVKKYEQNSRRYVKRLKSIQKTDKVSRQENKKTRQRQIIEVRGNLQTLNKRITSKNAKR